MAPALSTSKSGLTSWILFLATHCILQSDLASSKFLLSRDGPPDNKMYWVPVKDSDLSEIEASALYPQPSYTTCSKVLLTRHTSTDEGVKCRNAIIFCPNLDNKHFFIRRDKETFLTNNAPMELDKDKVQVLWFPRGAVTWTYIKGSDPVPQVVSRYFIPIGFEGDEIIYACRGFAKDNNWGLKVGLYKLGSQTCAMPFFGTTRIKYFEVLSLSEIGVFHGISVEGMETNKYYKEKPEDIK